ncbi:MAG: hypothetical protein AB7T31_04965 [Gemmatimonadales bacterium]
MQSLALLLVLALAPVLALSLAPARPTREPRFPMRIVATVLGLGVVLSLALASPRLGNRLSATEGYWPIAGNILLTYAVTIALPFLLAAGAVHLARRAESSRIVVLGAGVVAALVGWTVGVFLMFAVVWA